MPSRAEPRMSTTSVLLAVLRHELRSLLRTHAFWAMLLLLGPLTGYGYVEAVRLFAEASRAALTSPELARGMTPLDGVLVPTLGAFYLGTTLLFPFVAITALGHDRDSGALKLTLQWPLSTGALVALKLVALVLAWCASALVPLSALVSWQLLGGYLSAAETLNLLAGHFLYALVVIGIAMLASAATRSAASAAIVTLACTLGFWVLDFAGSSASRSLAMLAGSSPTSSLRLFETGLFSWPHALALATLGLTSAAVAAQLIEPAVPITRRARHIAALIALAIVIASGVYLIRAGVDVTEDRRNSFSVVDEQALRRMDDGLALAIYLAPEDSRAQELADNVLAKLERVVPDLTVRWMHAGAVGPFAAPSDDRYGRIELSYRGQQRSTRSTSPREVLTLLHELSGATVVAEPASAFGGHPLIADAGPTRLWFYLAWPALALLGAAWSRRRRRRRFSLLESSGEPR